MNIGGSFRARMKKKKLPAASLFGNEKTPRSWLAVDGDYMPRGYIGQDIWESVARDLVPERLGVGRGEIHGRLLP